jgi:hypothetical protein
MAIARRGGIQTLIQVVANGPTATDKWMPAKRSLPKAVEVIA